MRQAEYEALSLRMRHGYEYGETKGVGFFRAASLEGMSGLIHGFTARKGGVSAPPFDTLNLAFGKTEPMDAPKNVQRNFEIFCAAAGVPYHSLCIINFEHGTNVVAVSGVDCGRGIVRGPLAPCDGLVTNDPAVTLITSHADCGAFFLYDPVHRAVGAGHAGWKGMLGRIGRNLVEAMRREYGSNPADLIASNGPCICRNCYEVDEALAAQFEAEFGVPCSIAGRPGKRQLDLEIPAAVQLLEAGVRPENITLMHACTFEMPELLFSHRRVRGKTGDIAGFIKLT